MAIAIGPYIFIKTSHNNLKISGFFSSVVIFGQTEHIETVNISEAKYKICKNLF